jgi:hypothetical protein
MPDTMRKTLDLAVKDDAASGVYRVFELEMKHMFEGNWIYLALRK